MHDLRYLIKSKCTIQVGNSLPCLFMLRLIHTLCIWCVRVRQMVALSQKIEKIYFSHCNSLPQPHASNAACQNEPLIVPKCMSKLIEQLKSFLLPLQDWSQRSTFYFEARQKIAFNEKILKTPHWECSAPVRFSHFHQKNRPQFWGLGKV